MAEAQRVHVIVNRTLHGEGAGGQWQPVGYATSLEEAWAALDLLKERERAELHAAGEHPAEKEYEVWPVADAWGLLAR